MFLISGIKLVLHTDYLLCSNSKSSCDKNECLFVMGSVLERKWHSANSSKLFCLYTSYWTFICCCCFQQHCYPYWPVNNEPAAFGLLRVQIIEEEEHTGYVKRRFRTTNTKVTHSPTNTLRIFVCNWIFFSSRKLFGIIMANISHEARCSVVVIEVFSSSQINKNNGMSESVVF